MLKNPTCHLDRHRRSSTDGLGHLPGDIVERIGRDNPGHDPVSIRFSDVHCSSSEYEIAGHPRSTDLIEATHSTGVGDDPTTQFRQLESGTFRCDAYIAKERPLERATNSPSVEGDNDRCVKVEYLENA